MIGHGAISQRPKVSLRGASAKEFTRDAILEKAAQERALRSEARRAVSAALLIQRVWRGRHAACKAADNFRTEWDTRISKNMGCHQGLVSCETLVKCVRPFLYFMGRHRSCLHTSKILDEDHQRFLDCFTLLLQSISSLDLQTNYSSFSVGLEEQRRTWMYQVHELLRLCGVALVETTTSDSSEVTALESLAVRVLVGLTDASLWKCFNEEEVKSKARIAAEDLLQWIACGGGNLYFALQIYIFQRCVLERKETGQHMNFQKEKLLVIASTVTLAVRPLQGLDGSVGTEGLSLDTEWKVEAKRSAAEAFCTYILTIPFLTHCLPAVILPALQHPLVLTPLFQALVTSDINVSGAQNLKVCLKAGNALKSINSYYEIASPSAWALVNTISLVSDPSKLSKKGIGSPSDFVKGLPCDSYVRAVCGLLKQCVLWIESTEVKAKLVENNLTDEFLSNANTNIRKQIVRQLEPMCQQWHLKFLLDHAHKIHQPSSQEAGLTLSGIAVMYASLLKFFSAMNGKSGASPVLNLLAFAPGYLGDLWNWLDNHLHLTQSCSSGNSEPNGNSVVESRAHLSNAGALLQDEKPGGSLSSRWASAVLKIKGKANSTEISELDKGLLERQDHKENSFVNHLWDIETLKKGPESISEETLPILLLFCSAYGHLLTILEDEEFYEHQVPFTLEQQRVIAASLNTLVYNGIVSAVKRKFTPLMEEAIKCLNSLYGRDCRHAFCPPSLWLAPANTNHLAIPAAARAYEVAMSSRKVGDFSQGPAIGYVLKTVPHIISFAERVQIFREFIKIDKMSRKMAGEAIGSGPGAIEIAVRRDHLVEDAFAQLTSLGGKLKSGLNVSFVNEHGLQEAGLDYGGLFKEFLTDLAKAAFDPGYGLFIQTATEEGLLFPHPAAGNLQHGLEMLEFLGRIVGKALYEGILLDYSFSHVFVWKMLGRYIFLDELSTLDPELYQSLMYLKRYDGDVKELALDFTVMEEVLGRRTVVELISGGANVPVNNNNKLHYVHAMADYKLNRQMQPLISAFSKGLSDLIAPAWLTLFNAKEFNQLLSGGEHDFDVEDLKANTKYTGGFTETSRTVKQFWEVLKEFQPQERCALLKFVTSCSRAPLLGFKHLQPIFTIHKVSCDTPLWAILGGQDVERLPSASTCYNTLKLPTYKRIGTLRNKLRYAIHSNAGFELS